MSIDVSIEDLKEIASFVANPESRPARDQGLRYIVMKPLLDSGPLSLRQLTEQITKRYHVSFTSTTTHEIIDRLLGDQIPLIDRIGSADDPTITFYKLTDRGKSEILGLARTTDDPVKEADAWIVEKVKMHHQKELSEEEHDKVVELFHRFLATVFFARGLPCLQILMADNRFRAPDLLSSLIGDLQEYLKDFMRTGELSANLSSSFERTLSEFTTDFKASRLIDLLVHSYILVQILTLDPLGKRFLKQDLKMKTIFLDTNAMIAALCSSDMFHDDTVNLIKKMRLLGMKMKYTQSTIDEFAYVLGTAKEVLDRIIYLQPSIARRIATDTNFSVLQNFFIEECMSWDRYVDRLYSRLERLEEYGVTVDLIFDKRSLSVPASLTQDIRAICDKGCDEAAHDAYHIALVSDLRNSQPDKEQDSAWSNFWFLTWDAKLFAYDKLFAERAGTTATPSCMLGDGLEYLLRSFASLYQEGESGPREDEMEVFTGLIGSRFFEALNGLRRREESFKRMAAKAADMMSLEEDDYRRVLAEIRGMITYDAIKAAVSQHPEDEEIVRRKGGERT